MDVMEAMQYFGVMHPAMKPVVVGFVDEKRGNKSERNPEDIQYRK